MWPGKSHLHSLQSTFASNVAQEYAPDALVECLGQMAISAQTSLLRMLRGKLLQKELPQKPQKQRQRDEPHRDKLPLFSGTVEITPWTTQCAGSKQPHAFALVQLVELWWSMAVVVT